MKPKDLIYHLIESINAANKLQSNINPDIINIHGMSTAKIRHFINNICSKNELSYCEVGSWRGSTLCSAISNNKLNSVLAFENFSEFLEKQSGQNSVREDLLANIEKYKGVNTVDLIESDFFKNDFNSKNKYNIYLYDGIHRFESQYYQLGIAKKFLDTYSIVVVDDWFCNISNPRDATFQALADFKFKTHMFVELPGGTDDYWNGQGVFVLENL